MSRSHAHSRTAAMESSLLILPLIYCVVATPLKKYDSVEDKPISNLQFLIPFSLAGDQKSPAPFHSDYDSSRQHELPLDGPFSRIPSDSFTPDDDANFFTEEFIEPAKQKTVKKDLSQLETKTPRVQLQDPRPPPVDSITDTEDYLLRCQEYLRFLLERSEPKASRKSSSNNLLRSLCLLPLKKTDNNSNRNIFRSVRNKNTVLNSKAPATAPDFLAGLLGSEHSDAEDLGEKFFSLNGNNWKGEMGNLAINGHGGYAGNLGVGGKGKEVGNLGVGGKGGVYGNLGIGGQGALFGNLGIGGSGGELDEAYISKDAWSNHYQNGLLNFLLNQGGHGNLFGPEQEENVIPKDTRPVSNGQELSDDVAHETLVPPVKDIDNLGHRSKLYQHLDNDGYGRVSNNALLGVGQKNMDHTEIDKPHKGNQVNINDQSQQPLHKTQKPIGRNNCNTNDDRCGLRSLLVGGTGGLIGNVAVDSYNYGSLSKQSPSLRVYVVAVIKELKPELKGDSDSDEVESLSPSTYRPRPMKFRPINGRRDWTFLGKENKLLRQYINKIPLPYTDFFPENHG